MFFYVQVHEFMLLVNADNCNIFSTSSVSEEQVINYFHV